MTFFGSRRACLFTLISIVVVSVGLRYHWSKASVVNARKNLPGYSIEKFQREAMQSTMERNNARKEVLRRTCQRIYDKLPQRTDQATSYKHMIVDKKHRIMYCPIPKAACTTWKAFFMRLRGVQVGLDIHTQERTDVVHMEDLDEHEIETVLRNFTKFIIVRHPFTRILSAYRNKLEPNGTFEVTHSNQNIQFYWRRRLGADIIKTFYGPELVERFREHPEEYKLTFADFVNYLSKFKKKLHANNRHWKEMYSMCSPCDIEYDYIAKFETLAEDSLFFLLSNDLSTGMINHEQHATNSSTPTAVSQYYNNLPIESIENLYQRYKFDFQLFDYDPKSFRRK